MLALTHEDGEIFLINSLCLMKVLGVHAPRSRGDYESRKTKIIEHMRKLGVDFPYSPPERELDEFFEFYPIHS